MEAVSARLSLKLWSSASRLSGTNDGVMLSTKAEAVLRLCCGGHHNVLLGLKVDGFSLSLRLFLRVENLCKQPAKLMTFFCFCKMQKKIIIMT